MKKWFEVSWVIQIYVKVGGVKKREKAEGGEYFETVTPQCRFEKILLEDSYVTEEANRVWVNFFFFFLKGYVC